MNLSKPLKLSLITGLILLAGILCFVILGKGNRSGSPSGFETLVIQSKSGQHTFRVEVARTMAEQEKGLMFRTEMAADQGMLFEMNNNTVTRFWMKNTLIPLDMLFLAADGTVRKIHANAVPKSLKAVSSGVPVQAVLEINGGKAKTLGLAVGDKVIHPYFKAAPPPPARK